MLAVQMPKGLGDAGRAFLFGWSMCMQAMAAMEEEDKQIIKKFFEEVVAPEAHCQEMKELDLAFMRYLLHKCDSPEGIGSASKKKRN